jgi:hypothetical protein
MGLEAVRNSVPDTVPDALVPSVRSLLDARKEIHDRIGPDLANLRKIEAALEKLGLALVNDVLVQQQHPAIRAKPGFRKKPAQKKPAPQRRNGGLTQEAAVERILRAQSGAIHGLDLLAEMRKLGVAPQSFHPLKVLDNIVLRMRDAGKPIENEGGRMYRWTEAA